MIKITTARHKKIYYASSSSISPFQLQTIFESIPEKRQTLLFSATLSDSLDKVKAVADEKALADTLNLMSNKYLIENVLC